VDLGGLRSPRVIEEREHDRDGGSHDEHRPRRPRVAVAVHEERAEAAEETEQERSQPRHRVDGALPRTRRTGPPGSRRHRRRLRSRAAGAEANLGAVGLQRVELRPGLFPALVRARESRDGSLARGAVPDAEEVLGIAQEVAAPRVRVLKGAVLAQCNPFDEFTATTMIAMIPPATPIQPSTMPAIARPRPVCRPFDRSISLLPK